MRQQGSNHTVTQISLSMIKRKQVAKYIDRYFDFPDYRSSDGDRVLWLWTGKMESCKRSDFLRNYDGSFSGVSPAQLNELELRGKSARSDLRLPPVQCSRAKEICL